MNEEKNTNNEFSKEKLENTILNLKMLSEIKENDKLYLDDSLLKLDHPYLLQGLTSHYRQKLKFLKRELPKKEKR